MNKIVRSLGALALVALLSSSAAAATWSIDTTHSVLDFKVRHLFSKTGGTFNTWSGTIVAGDDLTKGSVEIEIDAASVDTNNGDRDKHLRSADFFDVENHPKLTFKSTKVEKVGENEYMLTGDFSMLGKTQQISFPFEFHGAGKDPWGNMRAGFSAELTINRKEFGMQWNQAMDQGGVILGDDVKIDIEIEAMQAKSGR